MCICSDLPDPALKTHTRIVVLVHPKEAVRKLGTAPILKLSLVDVIMLYAEGFPEPEEDPELHARLTAGGFRPALVCPGADAIELGAAGGAAGGEATDWTLIFIDGRWKQAKAMVNRSKWLQGLPRVVLRPTEQSGYTFRRQPVEGCLSTLEAVAEALAVLEGDAGAELKRALVAPFKRMVELQCCHIPGLRACDLQDGGDDGAAERPPRQSSGKRPPPKFPASWGKPGVAAAAA